MVLNYLKNKDYRFIVIFGSIFFNNSNLFIRKELYLK